MNVSWHGSKWEPKASKNDYAYLFEADLSPSGVGRVAKILRIKNVLCGGHAVRSTGHVEQSPV